MAQAIVEAVMGDDDNFSDDDSSENITGLRHLSYTESITMDMLNESTSIDEKERILHRTATDATELLINALWKLPVERTAQGPIATLPPQKSLVLPREKVIPEPKPQTRWEKFAEEKGIDDKKRSRMVWDDVEQKWAPRYGFKRAYDDTSIPIMEVKGNDDPYADPWEKKRAEKQERVAKNSLQRERNDERNDRRVSGMKSGIPVDLPGSKNKAPMQKGKDGVQKALSLAQHSTASMGKFDVKRVGEPTMRKPAGMRREKVSNDNTASGLNAEKERSAKIIKHVIAVAERPFKPSIKGDRGLRIEARKRSREFHPLDDTPFENLGGGDAGEYKKKKGRAAAGKMTKITRKRAM